MGNWGNGLFAGDEESDTIADYRLVRRTLDPDKAVTAVLHLRRGSEARSLDLVVLAAFMACRAEMTPGVAAAAIRAIDEARPGDRLRWGAGSSMPADAAARTRMLRSVRNLLSDYSQGTARPIAPSDVPSFLGAGHLDW